MRRRVKVSSFVHDRRMWAALLENRARILSLTFASIPFGSSFRSVFYLGKAMSDSVESHSFISISRKAAEAEWGKQTVRGLGIPRQDGGGRRGIGKDGGGNMGDVYRNGSFLLQIPHSQIDFIAVPEASAAAGWYSFRRGAARSSSRQRAGWDRPDRGNRRLHCRRFRNTRRRCFRFGTSAYCRCQRLPGYPGAAPPWRTSCRYWRRRYVFWLLRPILSNPSSAKLCYGAGTLCGDSAKSG